MFNFFKKITGQIKKTTGKLSKFVLPAAIDHESIKTIENMLLSSDFGVEVTKEIIEEIKSALKSNKALRRENAITIASSILKKNLEGSEESLDMNQQSLQVICLVGTNGSGKTTTAAKLAHFYKELGKKVLLGSCDTFRAAANEQLNSWGQRLAVDVVSSHHGADPAAVAFDAHKAAIARGKDILILDTAGRLHVKANLMSELQKILCVLKKNDENFIPNVWLVVDGTIGTNTIEVSKIFHEKIGLSGMIITKLDGTSVGGALVGVYKNLHIPIYFIGNGETPDSLQKFSVQNYVDGLFDDEKKEL